MWAASRHLRSDAASRQRCLDLVNGAGGRCLSVHARCGVFDCGHFCGGNRRCGPLRGTSDLTQQVANVVSTWSMAPVVDAYQSMRGVAFLTAVTFVAEIGDVRRFETPPI